jgi:hypothetical protein
MNEILNFACRNGFKNLVSLLLFLGARVDSLTFCQAAESGKVDVINQLLQLCGVTDDATGALFTASRNGLKILLSVCSEQV